MSRSSTSILVLFAVLIVVGVTYLRLQQGAPSLATAQSQARVGCRSVVTAYRRHEQGIWLTMSGTVVRVLADELGKYQHQRFIVMCPAGQTVLVVNDVSVGRRVPVRVGDEVGVRGQYIWNTQGGLIHFTHHGGVGTQSGWVLFHNHLYSLNLRRLVDRRLA